VRDGRTAIQAVARADQRKGLSQVRLNRESYGLRILWVLHVTVLASQVAKRKTVLE
jgi:hypothetical protein